MVSLSSSVSTAPSSLALSANLLRCTCFHCPCRQKDAEELQPQWQPQGTPLVTGSHGHNKPLSKLFVCCHPANSSFTDGPSIKSMSLQPEDEDVMWDTVKHFAEVQADVISCSALSTNVEFVRQDLPFVSHFGCCQ